MPKLESSNTMQAFWLALSSLSTVLISIVSAAILSRYFDKQSYGTYKQVIFIYSSFYVVFNAGLPKVFAYYLPRYTKEEGKYIVQKITSLLFVFGGLFSIFLFLTSDLIAIALNNEDLSYLIKLFSIVPFFVLPTIGVEGIFTSYRMTHHIAVYKAVTKIFLLACIIFPVILIGDSVEYAIYGWVLGSLFCLLIALVYKRLPFRSIIQQAVQLEYKDILIYSLPLVVASIAGTLIRSSDQFYMSRYFGEEVFAEYSNGFTSLPFVGMVSGAAAAVLMPVFSKYIHEEGNNSNYLKQIFSSTITKSALIVYPLVIFSMAYAEEIIVFLYTDKYLLSTPYFRLYLTLNFFNIVVFTPLLLALGETKFYAKMHFYFAIIAWVLGYVFVLLFGDPILLAALTVVLTIARIIIAMLKATQLLNVTLKELISFSTLFRIVLHCLFVIVIVFFLVGMLDFKSGIVRMTIGLLFYYILILSTSKLVNLDYFHAMKPLTNKLMSKVKVLKG